MQWYDSKPRHRSKVRTGQSRVFVVPSLTNRTIIGTHAGEQGNNGTLSTKESYRYCATSISSLGWASLFTTGARFVVVLDDSPRSEQWSFAVGASIGWLSSSSVSGGVRAVFVGTNSMTRSWWGYDGGCTPGSRSGCGSG